MQQHSLQLLQTRRFLPLFITQFLEAFNDNLFKNALTVMIAYQLISSAQNAEILVALAGAIFMLPFFLFSATSGQLADKYNKSLLIRIIKIIEILAMIMGAIGFYNHNIYLLMITLFILGTHSTFFGPIKYSILPDHLQTCELIGGNALIESSTFLSILFGTIVGSALINTNLGIFMVSTLGISCAIVGLVASFYIPNTKPAQPELSISINFIRETLKIIQNARENKTVFFSILGISWFWLIGVIFITLFPVFTKYTLMADSLIVTLLLAAFSIGISVGSMLCEQLQRGTFRNLCD